MKELFSRTGENLLEALTFTKTLYAFDFDGTLAPIVSKPEEAHAEEQTEALLDRLSTFAPIAIVSGRSISDLRKRIRIPIVHYIGNHGIEGTGLKHALIKEVQNTCAQWIKQLDQKKNRFGDLPGVEVENKSFSLSLHYRHSRNKKKARDVLFSLIQELQPAPRVILGKCVINLVPTNAPHKGIALAELVTALRQKCAFYIGDDETDEDVFSLPDPRIITTRVGLKKTSQAQFYIKKQKDMNHLLRTLIRFHENRDRL